MHYYCLFSSMTSQNLWTGSKIKKSLPFIPELLSIRIIQNDKIIGVYHLPEEVIVRLPSKKIEIYNENGSLIETHDLVRRNLSWLENRHADSSEILLDLHVKV